MSTLKKEEDHDKPGNCSTQVERSCNHPATNRQKTVYFSADCCDGIIWSQQLVAPLLQLLVPVCLLKEEEALLTVREVRLKLV